MDIAICDDSAQERRRTAGMLERYAEARGIELSLQFFSDGESMLREARTERFSHYFLDVMMPCMDGISVAREIRSFDGNAKIVFMTSFKEYAYQSYRVRAYDYLLKPVGEEELFALLDDLRAQEESAEEGICVQNGRSVFHIPFARLSHLEVNQKKLYFHLTNGQLRQLAGTMAEYEEELLARPEFVKIHRSYIVNLKQVSVVSPEGCILFSGKNLPISRLLYNQVRREYMTQLFGNVEV